jgi:hypothetical protein
VLPAKEATDIHGEILHEGNLPGALKNDTLRGLAKPSETSDDIAIDSRLIATDKDNQLNAALERLRGRAATKG